MSLIDTAAYGKERFAVVAWSRPPGAPVARARRLAFAIRVAGDFEESFRRGENRAVLPSDTLRRHAVAECATWAGSSVSELLTGIGRRILAANSAFSTVSVKTDVEEWPGRGYRSFCGSGETYRWAAVVARDAPPRLSGGLTGLRLMVSGGSAFTGFLRDSLTNQRDAEDRPLAGLLDADWTIVSSSSDGPAQPDEVAAMLGEAFTDRPSNSVQQLLYEMATTVLERIDTLSSIHLTFRSEPLVWAAGEGVPVLEVDEGPIGVTELSLQRPL